MAVAVKVTSLPALVGLAKTPLSDGPAVIEGALLNTQPELPETLVELLPGFHVAPPVAAESCTDR